MLTWKRRWYCLISTTILLVLLAFSIGLAAEDSGEPADSVTKWVWTEKYPKPGWWTWGREYWPTKPVRGGYFHEARQKSIGYMNPNHWPCNDFASIGYMYEFLVAAGGDLRPRVPWLAESWEYEDPLTAITRLKKGIEFHDGSRFNAEALKYHIEWIMDRKSGAFSRAWIAPIESVEVVDEFTVRWHFKTPWAAFIPMMAYVPGYIMSAEALKGDVALREAKSLKLKADRARRNAQKARKKADEEASKEGEAAKKAAARATKALNAATLAEKEADQAAARAKGAKPLDTHPVGTGNYMFEDISEGNYLKLKRNPNWWFGRSIGHPDMPYFDGIKVFVIPDPSVRLANLKTGKIDRIKLDKHQYSILKDDPKYHVYVFPQPDTAAYAFNSAKGPCRDILVRKAISHAIDRKALIHGIEFGLARIASCIYPGNHWAHNPNLKPVSFDPELAKQYLKEAGYENGLKLMCVSPNTVAARARTLAVKSMLAKIGIDLKVDSLDPVAVTDRQVNLQYDLLLWDFLNIDDPDTATTVAFHPDLNSERNKNEKVIALIEAGRREIDYEKRSKIYQELEQIVYDEYLDVWLWWEEFHFAYRENVQGWNNEMFIQGEVSYKHSHPLWFRDGKR